MIADGEESNPCTDQMCMCPAWQAKELESYIDDIEKRLNDVPPVRGTNANIQTVAQPGWTQDGALKVISSPTIKRKDCSTARPHSPLRELEKRQSDDSDGISGRVEQMEKTKEFSLVPDGFESVSGSDRALMTAHGADFKLRPPGGDLHGAEMLQLDPNAPEGDRLRQAEYVNQRLAYELTAVKSQLTTAQTELERTRASLAQEQERNARTLTLIVNGSHHHGYSATSIGTPCWTLTVKLFCDA